MIDRIDELEQKIAALLAKVHEAKAKIADLQRNNRELYALAEQKVLTEQENAQLQARVRELEEELARRDNREGAVQDRLRLVLGRIDTLEAEIMELEGGHAE